MLLRTGRYATFQPGSGVAVQISVGRPKFSLGYELAAEVDELKPFGLMHIQDDDDFERLYVERLDTIGSERILARLGAIAAEHRGQLVLLCFEDSTKAACHRRTAAWWLEQRAGIVVPELEPDQLTFDSREDL